MIGRFKLDNKEHILIAKTSFCPIHLPLPECPTVQFTNYAPAFTLLRLCVSAGGDLRYLQW